MGLDSSIYPHIKSKATLLCNNIFNKRNNSNSGLYSLYTIHKDKAQVSSRHIKLFITIMIMLLKGRRTNMILNGCALSGKVNIATTVFFYVTRSNFAHI